METRTKLTPRRLRRARRILGPALAGALVATALVAGAALAFHNFGDVPDDHAHADSIAWADENGITTGCGDGTNFCPADPVTRAQMVSFLLRLAGHDPQVDPTVDAATLDGHTAEELMAGEAGILDRQIVNESNTVEDGSVNTVEAACPDGTVVLGGGGRSHAFAQANNMLVPVAGDWHLTDSRPSDDGDGWVVRYQKREGSGRQTTQAYAICASVAAE